MTRKQVEEEYKKLMEEIENLKKINEEHKKINGELRKENDSLITVIDLVREYLYTHKLYSFKYDDEELFEVTTDKKAKDDLLEILERVNEK